MKIAIGTDHAGFKYKEKIKDFLASNGHEVRDFGTFSEDSCDYPDFILPVAIAVSSGEFEGGIVLGGSGNGEAIAANKVPGIRCTVCWDMSSAELARRHNNSNILSLGQRMIDENQINSIVQIWLETPFDGGRHQRRLQKIESAKLESNDCI
ncbi:MAG: ribose 5-phosphate isomerase B [Pseudomonadota bacterium]